MSTFTPDLTTIPVEFRQLIRASITRLSGEFRGTFGPEIVERFVYESVASLDGARVRNFIPLFAERFAKDRLWSLAKSQGRLAVDIPTVLFLCVQNAGRSQMAAGWLSHLAGERIMVMSGGSTPGSDVNHAAIEAMVEKGIDIAINFPKPWTDEVVQAAAVVITMGCGDACPIYPGKRYEDWEITDAAGMDLAENRRVRDEIESRVRKLMLEIEVVPADGDQGPPSLAESS